jgi:uncharacterized protein (TIRG00374 family)
MRLVLVLAVGLAVLGLIYYQIDVAALLAILGQTRPGWLVSAVFLLAPIVLLSAWRLRLLVPSAEGLAFIEANKLVLASVTLNLVLPSRMGDLAKAYFLIDRGRISGSLALSLVVFERLCDLLGLFLWCLVGLAFYSVPDWLTWPLGALVGVGLVVALLLVIAPLSALPVFAAMKLAAPARLVPRITALEVSWRELTAYFQGNRPALAAVVSMSVAVWFLHGAQIWFLILAVGAWAPFTANMVLAPLALLIGMVPITFAGIGTRDAAIILLYAPFFAPVTGAAVGLLCLLRYLLPGLAGLPFLAGYLAMVRSRMSAPGET